MSSDLETTDPERKCLGCGAVDPMGDEDAWHRADCPVVTAGGAQPQVGDWGPWLGIDPQTKKRTHFAMPAFVPVGDYEHAVVFQPGYRTDRKTFGQHGMDITWFLRGPRGVTQFVLSTGWVPGQERVDRAVADLFPMAADLGYHAMCPQYNGHQQYGRSDCHVLPEGGTCYYDGSTINAEPVLARFLVEGEASIWRTLTEYHDELVVA